MAEEFLDLLPEVDSLDGQVPPMPAYFLIGHGMELAFKALIILDGITDSELRRIGHNLEAARGRVPETYQSLVTPILAELSQHLTPIYAAKGFEYLKTGFARLPIYREIRDPVVTDIGHIRQRVEGAVRTRLREEEHR